MSEDQAVSSPAVDVAAIRAALSRATPGRWFVGEYGSTIATDADVAEPWLVDIGEDGGVQRGEDAELIVLLRNNAEALLDAWTRPATHMAGMLAEAERRGAVKALENLHDRIKPGMSLAVQIDAYIYAIQNGEVSP